MDLRQILLTLSKDKAYRESVEKAPEEMLVEMWKIFCEEADKEINREIVRAICEKARE